MSAPSAPAEAVTAALAAHDENFPIAFRLLPRAERLDMTTIYAFCRATDDLGDEAPGDRLAALDAWSQDLERAFGGPRRPHDARLDALRDTVARRRLDPDLFRRIVESNRMDQRQRRWEREADLLYYCEHSATPVGRMVLGVLGLRDEWRAGYSDATCIGLQLVNFWQDIRRDLDERDRIYLPREHMARFGVDEADIVGRHPTPAFRQLVAFETDRARAWLDCGAPLARLVPWRARPDILAFTAAGRALCDAIARRGYDTLTARPSPGRAGRARILAGALAHVLKGGA